MADAPTMKSRVVRGTSYSILGQAVGQGLRLVGNVLCSHLLFPGAYGMMATITTVQIGLEMLSDVGIQPTIIQHERGDDPSFLDTAWTVQVVRGLILWVVGSALAWPLSVWVYGQPELVWPLVATTTGAVWSGLASTKLASLYRHIELKRVFVINVTAQAIAVAAMILLAWQLRTVWALVAGAVVGTIMTTILSHLAIPGRGNRFHWEKDAAQTLISFGQWIFISTTITYLSQRFDVLVLPKYVPLDELGVYAIAGQLAYLPNLLGGQVISAVLLPALAAAHREGQAQLVAAYARSKRVILSVHLLVTLGLALYGPAFFLILYDARYADASWIIQLVMVTIWFQYLEMASSRALLAVGDARSLAAVSFAKLVTTAITSIVGWELGGKVGFILGLAAGAMVGHLVVTHRLHQRGIPSLGQDLRATAIAAAIGLLGAEGSRELAALTGWPYIAVSIGIATVLLAPIAYTSVKGLLAEIRQR